MPTQATLRRETPQVQKTVGLVSFMREHLGENGNWRNLKWTRQPDTFLVRVTNMLERQRAERAGNVFHLGFPGFMAMLNDWPDNEFVEDEDRRNNNRIFREEWEAMRATGCIGDNQGDCYRLTHFDYVPSDDEDED